MDNRSSSALPRVQSRLPAPGKSKLPAPPSSTQGTSIRPPSPVKSAGSLKGPPQLQKRASLLSVSRPSQNVSKAAPPPSKPVANKTNLPNAPRSLVRPTPAASSLSKPRPLPAKSRAIEDEETHDQLSSLDSFRSNSRQGFSNEPEYEEYDESPPEPIEDPPRKVSRPSLSDRTIESLNSVPGTPKDRRRSSFFNPVESPMAMPPPPRPGSSSSRSASRNGSRPGTSDGSFGKPLASPALSGKSYSSSAKPASRVTSRTSSIGSSASSRRSISGNLTSRLQEAKTPVPQRSASPAKSGITTPGSGVPKPSGLSKPSTVSTPKSLKPPSIKPAGLKPPASRPQSLKPPAAKPATKPEPKRVISNSSSALRQQIAAAKAAARKAQLPQHDSPQDPHLNGDPAPEEDFHTDPFNQAPRDEKHIFRNRVNTARMTGKLNIAAMSLKSIPDEVLKMYDSASMTESNVNWAEVVDLTRFVAADNYIEEFDDAVFPDRSAEELADDEDAQGNQFGGLEYLDLHGNWIISLPMGLRRLERLTSLNVANNKLGNGAFDIIAQIPALKELRLGHNNLDGNLTTSICELQHLEVLDLQHNRLLGLPDAIRSLKHLRVLNVSNNQLTAIPMDAFQSISLVDLDASSNALIGSLFPMGGQNGHPTLQHLNLANNSLAALAFSETLDMPRLEDLNITNNHMTILPSIASWSRLLTLTAGDNKLSDFPHGFTSLMKLRNVNVSSNDIRILDPEVGRMEGLEVLLLAANPLRERKFLTMSAADIKRDLKSRLAPDPSDDPPDSPITVVGAEDASPSSHWTLKGNGLLDLAAQSLTDDDLADHLESFLSHPSNADGLKTLHLQYNRLTHFPPSLALATNLRSLDLSGNPLSSTYLVEPTTLPHLLDLTLSKCNLTTLHPLLSSLSAPLLTTLNISVNRLSGSLPSLRHSFPSLTTLFASDNKFASMTAESLMGMHTVNLASNELAGLDPEIGLLWEEGLRALEVGGNVFRVPGHVVLGKGTEGVLRWLRGRLPEGHSGVIGREEEE
ncbi:uncharacterized protein MYCGRDRAFT_68433 [Zymoseptoria tritici IPO323]|uniref:L domain-like protein n=1 Tax=Zymoseptoria tritici (strain CBS 115943 / IPO323) TaxID=336722 RepID=F9X3P8_ZYMTI|nr:uncharacterized protein MYCGRDRAFT_68433 [Zymoseptoria tritici IPO323]EGP89935.1 hypothetical protein MYCGRDRAFT_68433 [Zymoseptoria tritici IPO323]